MGKLRVSFKEAQSRLDKLGTGIYLTPSSYRGVILMGQFTHAKCGHSWFARVTDVINGYPSPKGWKYAGCPKCTGRIGEGKTRHKRITIKEAQARLDKRESGIKVLRVGRMTEKGVFKCKNGHVWEQVATHVINVGIGCLECSVAGASARAIAGGFGGWRDSDIEKLGHTHRFVYIIEDAARGFKIGKSVNVKSRIRLLPTSKVIAKFKCTVRECTKLESALHRYHKEWRIKKTDDFFTKDIAGGGEYFTFIDWDAIREIAFKIAGVEVVKNG